jgi:hypothetical protein
MQYREVMDKLRHRYIQRLKTKLGNTPVTTTLEAVRTKLDAMSTKLEDVNTELLNVKRKLEEETEQNKRNRSCDREYFFVEGYAYPFLDDLVLMYEVAERFAGLCPQGELPYYFCDMITTINLYFSTAQRARAFMAQLMQLNGSVRLSVTFPEPCRSVTVSSACMDPVLRAHYFTNENIDKTADEEAD